MSNPSTASGWPLRSNCGIGGQRAQLEKASAVVGEGLLQRVMGQKRDQNNLITIPEDLSENDLAPPIATKCAQISKPVIIIHLSVFFLSTEQVSLTDCAIKIGSSANIQSFWPSRTTSPSCTQACSNWWCTIPVCVTSASRACHLCDTITNLRHAISDPQHGLTTNLIM